mmetsp:Transcript_9419/g.15382  ORF Transcript_9419/g.15382 Transcript_9419/m.15382 type:complete len:134 (-) Transcript_9419:1624-2025(-)
MSAQVISHNMQMLHHLPQKLKLIKTFNFRMQKLINDYVSFRLNRLSLNYLDSGLLSEDAGRPRNWFLHENELKVVNPSIGNWYRLHQAILLSRDGRAIQRSLQASSLEKGIAPSITAHIKHDSQPYPVFALIN